MISKVFVVYDSKAEAYLNPFLMGTRGQAIRAFGDTIADEKTQFNKHPEDFGLWEIGEFDDKTGTYMMYEHKQNLGLAIELQQKLAKQQ